jgi:hypothetical protein
MLSDVDGDSMRSTTSIQPCDAKPLSFASAGTVYCVESLLDLRSLAGIKNVGLRLPAVNAGKRPVKWNLLDWQSAGSFSRRHEDNG